MAKERIHGTGGAPDRRGQVIDRMDRTPTGRRVVIVQNGDPMNGRKGRIVRYPDAWSALVLPFPILRDPEPAAIIVMRSALQAAGEN
jgi:hypothetical protein